MSAATATAETVEPAPAKKGKKKLILIAVALAVVLAGGGGAAFVVMKKRAAAAALAAEEGGEHGQDAEHKDEGKPAKANLKSAPTFLPLDPFTVNLADREAERYAQVGMTLELADAKAGDLIKAYMPAIRNNILLVLSGKSAAQLLDHEGKLALAIEVRAAALTPLGYEHKAAKPGKPAAADAHDEDTPPIRAVHFSNFIVQ